MGRIAAPNSLTPAIENFNWRPSLSASSIAIRQPQCSVSVLVDQGLRLTALGSESLLASGADTDRQI
jgi:hypothetical protein